LDGWLVQVNREREHVLPALAELPIVQEVFPTDANFVLVRVTDANRVYQYLIGKGIVVRNRHRVQLCNDCLRITIGTRQENNELLGALRFFK
jgi:histidinol-phosphate aminotransferase